MMVSWGFLLMGAVTVALAYWLYHPLPDGIASPWRSRALIAAFKVIRTACYLGEKLGISSQVNIFRTLTETVPVPRYQASRLETSDAVLNGVKVRIYRPKSEQNSVLPALVYYHGGGWVYGTVDTYDGLVSYIAVNGNITVLSVDYRRAPEHLYPAALDDCENATRYLLQNAAELRVDPNRIGIAGDSAGGNLATAVALRLREDRSVKPVRFQGLIYPALQAFDFRLPAYETNNDAIPYLLPTKVMVEMWLLYFQGHVNDVNVLLANQHTSDTLKKSRIAKYISQDLLPSQYYMLSRTSPLKTFNKDVASRLEKLLLDPFATPLSAEKLGGLPPAYIATAEFDVLRDDGLLYVRRLQDAGVQVHHSHWDSAVHGFYSFINTPFESEFTRTGIEDFLKYIKTQGF